MNRLMGRHLDDSVDVDGFCLWMADSDTSVYFAASMFVGVRRLVSLRISGPWMVPIATVDEYSFVSAASSSLTVIFEDAKSRSPSVFRAAKSFVSQSGCCGVDVRRRSLGSIAQDLRSLDGPNCDF